MSGYCGCYCGCYNNTYSRTYQFEWFLQVYPHVFSGVGGASPPPIRTPKIDFLGASHDCNNCNNRNTTVTIAIISSRHKTVTIVTNRNMTGLVMVHRNLNIQTAGPGRRPVNGRRSGSDRGRRAFRRPQRPGSGSSSWIGRRPGWGGVGWGRPAGVAKGSGSSVLAGRPSWGCPTPKGNGRRRPGPSWGSDLFSCATRKPKNDPFPAGQTI